MTKPIIIMGQGKGSLAGHFLIATPQIQDDFFKRSVIYMVAHNQEGAMGVIINTPINGVTIQQILEQMQMNVHLGDRQLPVMFGGPVEAHRGFVLHNGNYLQDSAASQHEGIVVTANAAVLTGWLEGEFTAKAMLAIGYAGWTAGQLESELTQGSWVSIPATQQLLFDTPHEAKWDVAVASLGFDMGNLSTTVGHA